VSTGMCHFCGTAYDLPGEHTCNLAVMTTGTAVAQRTSTPWCDGHHAPGPCPPGRVATHWCQTVAAVAETMALSDADVDRLAARVERRLAERARLRGG